MNVGAHSFLLSSVPWDVFCTLTYKDAPSTEEAVRRHVDDWLLKVRLQLRLHPNNFFYFFRVESGEQHQRLHAHVLLRVPRRFRGSFLVPHGCVSWAHKAWGRGMTKFRSVDTRGDSALSYVEKDTSGRDSYELQKTAQARHCYPSSALLMRAARQQSWGAVADSAEKRARHGQLPPTRVAA